MKKHGFNNPFCQALLITMLALIIIGAYMLYKGDLIGFIPLMAGLAMTKGLKELSPANPRKMGLITFFGKRQDDSPPVSGLILTLNIFIEIVGVVEFDMRKRDNPIPIKSLRCYNGVRVGGKVSISLTPNPMDLGMYDDAGQMDGAYKQLDDLITTSLQKIATQSGHTSKWMESNPDEIRQLLKADITNMLNNGIKLGVIIENLQVDLIPINTDFIKADEKVAIEGLERKSQSLDTATVNKQALIRFKMYLDERRIRKEHGLELGPCPTLQECRDEIFKERLAEAKLYQQIENKGGINVANPQVQK